MRFNLKTFAFLVFILFCLTCGLFGGIMALLILDKPVPDIFSQAFPIVLAAFLGVIAVPRDKPED